MIDYRYKDVQTRQTVGQLPWTNPSAVRSAGVQRGTAKGPLGFRFLSGPMIAKARVSGVSTSHWRMPPRPLRTPALPQNRSGVPGKHKTDGPVGSRESPSRLTDHKLWCL
eukprot:913102-Prorocentrum_minimum.AAC.1